MGASVAEPERRRNKAEPRLALSAAHWDPASPGLSERAVAVARERIETVLADLSEERASMEARGADLGLARHDAPVAVPPEWAASPGSPTYYLRVAEGYMRAAVEGTVCRDDFPESYFANVPPPADNWLCGHTPPHPRSS